MLTIAEQAKINMSDEAGQPTTEFTAGSSVLDRLQNILTLDGKAHVLRNQQVIDADHVTTRLSDDEQIVQYIELRNNARVTGGASIDSMSARDIDMDYTDDGSALERVALNGGAGVAMKGLGGSGRQIVGEALEVRLAPDGVDRRAHRTREGPPRPARVGRLASGQHQRRHARRHGRAPARSDEDRVPRQGRIPRGRQDAARPIASCDRSR